MNQIWKIVARVSTLTNDEEEERGQIWLLKHDGEMTTTGQRRHVVVRHFLNWQIEPFVKLNRFLAYRLSNRPTTTLILSCFVIHHPSSITLWFLFKSNLQRTFSEPSAMKIRKPSAMKIRKLSANLQIVCRIEPFSGEPSAMKTRKHQQHAEVPTTPTTAPKSFEFLEIQERKFMRRWERVRSVIFLNWWGGNERERERTERVRRNVLEKTAGRTY